ncbi:MAG: ADP-ribose pyrophosphatase [Acidimicrobiaceae bacterium]|nr:ADP-ribose pyrophosphatase [Acidimicrobiaceae bacterium]
MSFRRVSEEVRFEGSLISVATATFVGPDGEEFERDVVHHPGAVSVVPVVARPGGGYEAILVRQYRAAVDAELLEVVAGKRDVAGEPPELTARRELAEEIGMIAGRLDLLAEFYNSPGFCDEHSYVFVGLDLKPTESEAHGIEEQYMTIERVALDDVGAMIRSRQIVDAKTIIGLTLARQALESMTP